MERRRKREEGPDAHTEADLSTNLANQADEEGALFKAFLKAKPNFAGEKIAEWSRTGCGYDPPDVICTTVSRKRVGVEICQWAHQEAMADGKARDQINQKVLKAIGPQPVNKSEHFSLVFFRPKSKPHLSASKHEAFRKAFFALIEDVDREWPTLGHRGRPYRFRDLERYKPLDECLETITFCPPNDALHNAVERAIETCGRNTAMSQTGEERSDWIVPAGHPAQWVRTPYDNDQWEPDDDGNVTMEGCLLRVLKRKADSCTEPKLKTPCGEVCLLVAFHEAIPYCPPMPRMQDIAKKAADRARSSTSWP